MNFFAHPGVIKGFNIAGIALLCAGICYGGYRVYRDEMSLRAARIQIASLSAALQTASEQLATGKILSENEKAALAAALEASKTDLANLEANTEDLQEAVKNYKKLDSLDPELLKKYSKVYFLNENYTPTGLADIDPDFIKGAGRKLQIHNEVWPRLDALLTDAKDADLSLLVTSAYRSFGSQAALKSGYVVRYGTTKANSFSADQGYSEHQLGTTVDFITGKASTLSNSFDQTPEYKWLVENAYTYGFTLSYPKGNKYYIYEPWHWRYVGIELATQLHDEEKHLYDMDQRDLDSYLLNIFD
jgi:LAS superfamily LD-carboxypeptidase LdcB